LTHTVVNYISELYDLLTLTWLLTV